MLKRDSQLHLHVFVVPFPWEKENKKSYISQKIVDIVLCAKEYW